MRSFGERAALLERMRRTLRQSYGRQTQDATEDVALQFLKFVLLEESTQEAVEAALTRLGEHFVDLNELRVSFPKEVAAALPNIPRVTQKASCITRLFNAMFLKHNTMNWEFVRSLNVRDLRQKFEKIDGGGAVMGAAAVMLISSGHAMPADADVRRVLDRLGLTEDGEDLEGLQAFLERAISKDRGYETWALLHRLGEKVCVSGDPLCRRCPLRSSCRTGKSRASLRKKAGKRAAKPKGKARKSSRKSAK